MADYDQLDDYERDWAKRKELGEKYLRGSGIEIGAGLIIIDYGHVDELLVVDKRDAAGFEAFFGQPSPVPLHTPADAAAKFPRGCGFVVAHQVLEHCVNPIRTLRDEWIPLLADGAILFLGLPSSVNVDERERPVTPIEHILDDFYLDRDEYDYESIQHTYSFILQWAAVHPRSLWYAEGDAESFAKNVMIESRRREPDLHWHTYTLATATALIEVAFYAAGCGLEWLHREETDNCLYLVCRRTRERVRPDCLVNYKSRLIAAAEAI